ncbi:RHS repeat-associated core domain-containing protein, partial [Chryseobacterium gambrini]
APLQSIDYDYNIRGWMTEINKNQMAATDLGGKLFSYKIKYTSRDGIENPDTAQFSGKNVVPKYNGNIAEVDWRAVESIGANPSTTPKRYGYAYDKINRLTAGFYQNPQKPNSKENTESLAYDLNGNITSLYRTSVLEYGNTTPTMIDNLQYIYASGNISNRLTNINDHAQNATGYEGGGQTIGYDVNGNMISMPDKGISMIKYNHLNLPHHLEYSRDGIEMVKLDTKYRADGTKLRKVNTTTISGINGYTTSVKTIDYLDGFQYQNITNSGGGGGGSSSFSASNLESSRAMETQAFSLVDIGGLEPIGMIKNSDLQFFPTAEGFYDYQKDQYIYQYKDHLGNTRVSFGRNSAGALEIVDANDYYPFGMNHLKSGNSFFGSSSYKNYKYNGKELQESGMYDYGARFYMADIGRWGVVDELAEKSRRFTPYNYAVNNPIMFIDPDGREAQCCGKYWNSVWTGFKQEAKNIVVGSIQLAARPGKVIGTTIGTAINDAKAGKYSSAVDKITNLTHMGTTDMVKNVFKAAKGDGKALGTLGAQGLAVAVAEGTGRIAGAAKGARVVETESSTSSLNGSQLSRSQMNSLIGGGGAERAAQYSSQWESASLSETIQKIAPESQGVTTTTGKTIYNNSETGLQVVYDNAGNYFRIEDTNLSGRRVYLDLDGNVPNNKTVNGKQLGRSQGEYNQVTHFNNID